MSILKDKTLLILSFIVIILLAIMLSGIGTSHINVINMKSEYAQYTNKTLGFSVYYPKNWSVQNMPYNTTMLYPSNNSSAGGDMASVTIQYNTGLVSTTPVTLDDYTRFAVMAPRSDGNPKFWFISSNNTILSGTPAIEDTYTDVQNNISIKGLLVYALVGNIYYYDTVNKEWVYGGKTYTIEYIAKEDAFDKYIDDVNKIINYFTITMPPPGL